jgi:signal transduction histidine kinase
MMVIGGLIGANVGGRKRYVEALIEHSRRLVVERDQQAQLAASAERERIARELHDIVAHSLTVMVALAEGVAASKDAAHARPGAEAISATGREALRDMRATLGVLRDTDAAPLAPLARDTTEDTVASARAAGFETHLTVVGEPDVPSATRLAVSRIVQEGVTNVLRHARAATRIDVEIRYTGEGVAVSVIDDGRGVPSASGGGGFGLRGVRERVELVGGTVTAGPGEARGWVVHAWLPRKEEE